MKKIAHRAGEWRQPPHFRAKMSESLERQIRRGGRPRAAPRRARRRLVVVAGGGERRRLRVAAGGVAAQVSVGGDPRVPDLHACPCARGRAIAGGRAASPERRRRRSARGDARSFRRAASSPSRVRDWEERCAHAFPPEAAAAQCCSISRRPRRPPPRRSPLGEERDSPARQRAARGADVPHAGRPRAEVDWEVQRAARRYGTNSNARSSTGATGGGARRRG